MMVKYSSLSAKKVESRYSVKKNSNWLLKKFQQCSEMLRLRRRKFEAKSSDDESLKPADVWIFPEWTRGMNLMLGYVEWN
jgi:hypothetical protein